MQRTETRPAVATKRAEVILTVRVRLSGEIKDLDQAKVFASNLAESGSAKAAGLEGVVTVDIESGAVTFASMG
jgi:hypothetical protein